MVGMDGMDRKGGGVEHAILVFRKLTENRAIAR